MQYSPQRPWHDIAKVDETAVWIRKNDSKQLEQKLLNHLKLEGKLMNYMKLRRISDEKLKISSFDEIKGFPPILKLRRKSDEN